MKEVIYRTVFACASCGDHIDGDEVKIRTDDGWLPYHPICAPKPTFRFGISLGGGTPERILRNLVEEKRNGNEKD